MLSELTLARADGSYARLLARLARADVLVLDDWTMVPTSDAERRDLLEVLEDLAVRAPRENRERSRVIL